MLLLPLWLLLGCCVTHTTVAAPVTPPDVSLSTFPVVYYGANWNRSQDNLEVLSRMSMVILMQEDGECWLKCCPNATNISQPGQCGNIHNATSLPGCGPECDQHGKQGELFTQIKAIAKKAGRRSPHCVLYMNAVYDFPFDQIHKGGDAMDVLDIHGQPHMESCDPGIFPSFFTDFGRKAGQNAWLSIVQRAVVEGSADGVYADCYGKVPFHCPKVPNGTCTARRNGKKISLNEVVSDAVVDAYKVGKNATMRAAAQLVGPNGSFYPKLSRTDRDPIYGKGSGNLIFVKWTSDVPADTLADKVKTALKFYKYVVVGSPNGFSNPKHQWPGEDMKNHCHEDEMAAFLIAVESGAFLLCNGFDDNLFTRPLGLPLAPATQDPKTGTWSRSFIGGTNVTWNNGTGHIQWASPAIVDGL